MVCPAVGYSGSCQPGSLVGVCLQHTPTAPSHGVFFPAEPRAGMSSRCARCCWPSLPQVVVVVARFRSTSGLAQAIHAHPAEVTHNSIHMIATSWLAKALIARSWPLFDRPFTAPCTIGTCFGRDMDWDQGSSSVLFK